MRKFLFLLSLAFAAPAIAKDLPPNPEALVCPPTRGDLDYVLFRVMDDAKFVEWGGRDSWRRRGDGPWHWASLDQARYLRVEYQRFHTIEGTRLVAVLWWQTSRYEFAVEDARLLALFQDTLDKLAQAWPCSAAAR